jgi:hypothetical protein
MCCYAATCLSTAAGGHWEGTSEMKGERIEQREVGGDRHDAQVERMERRERL